MTERQRTVDASPDKHLFVETLTRDIQLIPAIADLVDNSVDGALRVLNAEEGGLNSARRRREDRPLQDFRIALTLSKDEFSISDNCGGIDEEVARKYAFRFGRPEEWRSVPHGVGQFGVGMKRALFKIGRHFRIDSKATASRFILDVDIDAWADTDDWEFEFDHVDGRRRALRSTGTEIVISDLQPDVKRSFSDDSFLQSLRVQLELHHQSPLEQGVSITANGRALQPYKPTLLYSDAIRPVVCSVKAQSDHGPVTITIRAGIADDLVDVEPEKRAQAEKAGWYVFCNERLILAANKEDSTGWGLSTARYHPQYRAFRGFCYIDAEDPAALPWNTTKTGLDLESRVYKRARQEMAKALKEVQGALNALKNERQRVDEPSLRNLELALTAAQPKAPKELPVSAKFVFPKSSPESRRMINVLYKVDKRRMEAVQEALGASSAREAGLMAFEYFYENEVED